MAPQSRRSKVAAASANVADEPFGHRGRWSIALDEPRLGAVGLKELPELLAEAHPHDVAPVSQRKFNLVETLFVRVLEQIHDMVRVRRAALGAPHALPTTHNVCQPSRRVGLGCEERARVSIPPPTSSQPKPLDLT